MSRPRDGRTKNWDLFTRPRRLAELLGQQLVGAAAGLVVVGDRDHDHLLGAVGGGDLLDLGADLRPACR